MITAAEILRRAAARLVSNGWQQHGFGYPEGPTCAGGAINYTCDAFRHKKGWRDEIEDEALRALRRRTKLRIVDWNDTPGRTRDEIVLTLTAAASDLEGA